MNRQLLLQTVIEDGIDHGSKNRRAGAIAPARILVVDDTLAIHADFARVLMPSRNEQRLLDIEAEIFGERGESVAGEKFRLDCALQGMEALQFVKRSMADGDPYSLAFVDMRMPPGWDGLETVQRIWEVDPAVQMVICSAYSDHDWKEVISRLGHLDKLLILKKPFESIEVLQCANALAHKWRSEQRLGRQLDSLEAEMGVRTASLERANELLLEESRRREIVERELGLAQKLEAVGRLASGIAHEINTPIQFIGDSVYFLSSAFEEIVQLLDVQTAALESIEQPDETQRQARLAVRQAELGFLREEIPRAIARTAEGADRVTRIVRAMKDFAHPGEATKALADLNRALDTTLIIARNEYKYVATIHTCYGEIPQVSCNIGELSQVFLNLIVNAAHALGEAGRTTDSGRIGVSTRAIGEAVEIIVEDNGCGMSNEVLDKIYEPFFTTKEVGRGTGQGLAIARTIIVDHHGGQIHVDSALGSGTRFTLRLPVEPREGAK